MKHLKLIKQELDAAISKYPNYHSEHEAFAVLLEEVDELWEAVRQKQSDPTRLVNIKKELIQVAAVTHRFLNMFDE